MRDWEMQMELLKKSGWGSKVRDHAGRSFVIARRYEAGVPSRARLITKKSPSASFESAHRRWLFERFLLGFQRSSSFQQLDVQRNRSWRQLGDVLGAAQQHLGAPPQSITAADLVRLLAHWQSPLQVSFRVRRGLGHQTLQQFCHLLV